MPSRLLAEAPPLPLSPPLTAAGCRSPNQCSGSATAGGRVPTQLPGELSLLDSPLNRRLCLPTTRSAHRVPFSSMEGLDELVAALEAVPRHFASLPSSPEAAQRAAEVAHVLEELVGEAGLVWEPRLERYGNSALCSH